MTDENALIDGSVTYSKERSSWFKAWFKNEEVNGDLLVNAEKHDDKSDPHRVLGEQELPDDLKKKFIVSDKAQGQYFFHDRKNDLAFQDKGIKLLTREEKPEVIESMVHLCKAKGWKSINVTGSQEFKKEAWLNARFQGLKVTGYEPSKEDLARLDVMQKSAMKNSIGESKLTEPQPNSISASQDREHKPETQVEKLPKKRLSMETMAMASVAQAKGMSQENLEKFKLKAEGMVQQLKKLGIKIPPLKVYDANAPVRARGKPVGEVTVEQKKDIEQPQISPPVRR